MPTSHARRSHHHVHRAGLTAVALPWLKFWGSKISYTTSKQASMPHHRNACLHHYSLTGVVMTLTSDLEKLFSNAHSHDKYLWLVTQPSTKYRDIMSCEQVLMNGWNTATQMTGKYHVSIDYCWGGIITLAFQIHSSTILRVLSTHETTVPVPCLLEEAVHEGLKRNLWRLTEWPHAPYDAKSTASKY